MLTLIMHRYSNVSGIVFGHVAGLQDPEAGWIGRDAILMTGINALFYVASSIPP
jgi:hypothetical protein